MMRSRTLHQPRQQVFCAVGAETHRAEERRSPPPPPPRPPPPAAPAPAPRMGSATAPFPSPLRYANGLSARIFSR
jgi:hypothetical protein